MKLHTVGTGSDGNCYLLQRDNDRIIALDCGCAWKKVMIAARFKPTLIDFALVTHSHSDHSKFVRDFKLNGINVYGVGSLNVRRTNSIKDAVVVPFEVPHDVTCYGYLIRVDHRTIIYMTDFGYCRHTFKTWGVDTFIIACNHTDLPDIDEAKYAHVIKGHSSLDTVRDIISVNFTPHLKNVVLVHYSEDSDTDMMVREIQADVGDGVKVSLAKKGEVIEL